MSDSEYIERVVRSLKKVPPKNLLIIDLVNRYMKDGQLDYDALAEVQPEVDLAIAEAKLYTSYTLQAVDALLEIEDKKADVGPGNNQTH